MTVDVEQPNQPAGPAPAEGDAAAVRRKRKKKFTKRSDELSERPEIEEKLLKIFDGVEKCFGDQRERADRIMDNWDAYDCVLSRYQSYTGGLSELFIPIIRNGVNAIVTRYVNQAFPQSGRHVEVVTGEEEIPYALMSLLEHYIERGQLRTQAAAAILLNGQIEGQYNACVNWNKIERWVVSRETEPMQHGGMEFPELGEVETIAEQRIDDSWPGLEVLHDADVAVHPATAESIDHALEIGGSVSVVRRWTKDQIKEKIKEKEIVKEEGEDLIESMGGSDGNTLNTAKKLAHESGIHASGKTTFALVYEVWTKLKVDDRMRLCRIYFAGEGKVLSCKLNPYWNDKCPILSGPVEKLPGVFKGESPVKACLDMQYWANDMANESAHAMYFTLAPILAVDPVKVSKWKDLVTDVAAVWPVDPAAVKLIEWPNKVREAMEVIQACKASIFETLGVNPSMLPQQTGVPGRKRNQAEVALEQQADLLNTADAVTNLEGEILTPAVQRFADYDHQFRDKEVLVREFGELGLKAGMQRIEPIQMGNRYRIRWSGVEAARNAANIQQQIGFLATIQKIPPQLYMGYRLNAAPILEYATGQIFPSRLARQTFVSMQDDMTVDPKLENQMLDEGFEVLTHAADDDQQHMQEHMRGMQKAAASGNQKAMQEYRAHILRHQHAMQMKQAAQAQAQQQGGPQVGGGKQRPGSMPSGPKQPQRPNGAIHPDQMSRAGAPQQPRKT